MQDREDLQDEEQKIEAVERKYPEVAMEWGSMCFLRVSCLWTLSGKVRRHHLDPSPVNKAVARAVSQGGNPEAGECFSRQGGL